MAATGESHPGFTGELVSPLPPPERHLELSDTVCLHRSTKKQTLLVPRQDPLRRKTDAANLADTQPGLSCLGFLLAPSISLSLVLFLLSCFSFSPMHLMKNKFVPLPSTISVCSPAG